MKKSFFRERTVNEIQGLNLKRVYTQKNLIKRIDDLDPSEDALEIRVWLIPGRFFINTNTMAEASRKCYHHGELIPLDHPKTKKGCFECPDIPLQIRERDFSKYFRERKEEEINCIGYSCTPGWGDRKKRVFPFAWIDDGVKIYGYDEYILEDDDLRHKKVKCYSDAKRVKQEGAAVVAEVPSRTRKKSRYKFKLLHVPVVRNQHNLATILSLKPALLIDEQTQEPIQERSPHELYNTRYTYETDPEGSEIITYYPQDIAAYLQIIKYEMRSNHNWTPLVMNPFALTSRHRAEFYKKLGNNIIVFDPTLTSKNKLRKLHVAEKCISLARGIKIFEHDDFAYWDPERDGKLKDYNWSINLK